jgi:hypothetical protein
VAHEDLNLLMNELLPFAKQMLATHGEFFPFGGYVDVRGRITHVGGSTGEEQPPSQAVIDVINGVLRERAERGEIRASGICVDVLTIPPGEAQKRDAVSVRLEHVNGESVIVFLPYRAAPAGGYEYGELFAIRGGHDVFRSAGGTP